MTAALADVLHLRTHEHDGPALPLELRSPWAITEAATCAARKAARTFSPHAFEIVTGHFLEGSQAGCNLRCRPIRAPSVQTSIWSRTVDETRQSIPCARPRSLGPGCASLSTPPRPIPRPAPVTRTIRAVKSINNPADISALALLDDWPLLAFGCSMREYAFGIGISGNPYRGPSLENWTLRAGATRG